MLLDMFQVIPMLGEEKSKEEIDELFEEVTVSMTVTMHDHGATISRTSVASITITSPPNMKPYRLCS